ncbi:MAG: hypothetical protein ACJ8FY_08680, partial [Gemmataceae bacterium]
MIRLPTLGALTVAFCLGSVSIADEPGAAREEPPVRLKKKTKPGAAPENKPAPDSPKNPAKQPGPPKVMDPQDDPEAPSPDEPEADEQELLNRIAKNMRSAETRLANKELGEDTNQVQRDILKDLDRLIDQDQKANQNPSSSSADKSSSASKSIKNSQGKQSAQGRKQAKKNGRDQAAGNKKNDQPQQQTGQQPGGKKNGA